MRTYREKDLEEYVKNDWIMSMLEINMIEEEQKIRTNQWLINMENKRLIYADVYGDILRMQSSRKVLDVGGGLNSLTKILAANSQYTLLDFLAHGGKEYLTEIEEKSHIRWVEKDWYEIEKMENYDVIIANDIFPDVDQRMELFISRMLPYCRELRLVVTYYNCPCFYTTKRIDDSEIMTFLSWDGEITAMKLKKYIDRSNANVKELEEMKVNVDSIYQNGRQVSYLVIQGDLKN